jgi:hypothetical protein
MGDKRRAAKTLRDEFAMAALTGYAANARVMDKVLDDWSANGGPRPT